MPKEYLAKDRILAERGLVKSRPNSKRNRVFTPIIKPTYDGHRKTPLMRYLEQKYKQPIEEIIVSGSLSVVAKKLGSEVDVTTISKWIKRFKLRYNESNLPSCMDCKLEGPACSGGICYILLNLGLYDLIGSKKKEVLNEGNLCFNKGT